MAEGQYKLAVLDDAGVLVGWEFVDDELLWVPSPNRYPVALNADNALKRYRLVINKANGKGMFLPIVHEKDGADENVSPSVSVNPVFVAEALLELHETGKLDDASVKTCRDFLKSYDAMGVKK